MNKTAQFIAFSFGLLSKEAEPFDVDGSPPREPSDKQKVAGNYKKDHIKWGGMQFAIENRAGTTRSGVDKHGHKWSTKMPWHYGYINRTISGGDREAIDVFLKPDSKSPFMIYIIKQNDPATSRFDEYKCMIGWRTKQEAVDAYHKAYERGWKGFAGCLALPVKQFRKWLRQGGPSF